MSDLMDKSNTEHKLEHKINTDFEEVLNAEMATMLEMHPNHVLEPFHSRILLAHNQSLEAAVRAARIEELKNFDGLTYSFMSLGNDFTYQYRQSAVDARIAELQALPNKEPTKE